LEVKNLLRRDLKLSGYSQVFTDSIIRSKGNSQKKEEEKNLGTVYIPYVKDISETFKRIWNQYNIRSVFKTKHTLASSLVRTRAKRDSQRTAQCVDCIPCECGRSYIGETVRPLAVRIREQRYSLKQGLLENSKLAQHAYEESLRVSLDEPGFSKLNVTADIEGTKNHFTWHVQPI
jgi:hypothetical protein